MLKKSLALLMVLAMICSLCACGNGGSKTTYLTLAKEMQMIEGQEVKGSVEIDVSSLLEDLDTEDLANQYDISKLELSYEGVCNKTESDLDVKLKLGKLGDITIDYVSKEDELYIHKDLVTDILDLIVDVAKDSGEVDAMTESMIKEFEKSFDDVLTEDYILIDVSELAESSGVSMDMESIDMSKISFVNTTEKLDVFLQLCNSTIITKTKDGYVLEVSKKKVEDNIENIKKALAKNPEKFLQSMVDVIDALDSDLSNISDDLSEELEGMRETSKEMKEIIADKEGMKEFKKSLKDEENMKEFEEIFEDLDFLDGFILKSTINKDKETYKTVTELTLDNEDVKGFKIKLEQTVTPKDVSVSAPKSSISIEDLLESAGLLGSMSMGDSNFSGSIYTEGYDEDFDIDYEEDFDIDYDEDEEEEIKEEKKKDDKKKENKKNTTSGSGILEDCLANMTDIDDCEEILKDINSSLDGSWKESYRNEKSDYVSITFDNTEVGDSDVTSKLMLMDNNYAAYTFAVRFSGADNKEEYKEIYYEALNVLLGKNLEVAEEDLEDLVDKIMNGKAKDKNFSVDIGEMECSFYGYFSDDEDPEFEYYSLSFEVNYSNRD